jgi:hypothetical protein
MYRKHGGEIFGGLRAGLQLIGDAEFCSSGKAE